MTTKLAALVITCFAVGLWSGTEHAEAQISVPTVDVRLTGLYQTDLDALVEEYGEALPDEYHPPVPARSPGSMEPDPVVLETVRRAYAEALERNGYTEKAARVRRLSGNVGTSLDTGIEARAGSVANRLNAATDPTTGLAGACDDCDDTTAWLCNHSDTWLKIKGDYFYWSGMECLPCWVGWVGPGQCAGNWNLDWQDVDDIWNCLGDLRVGSKTYGAGTKAWHQINQGGSDAYDDPSYPDVWLDTCGWPCKWVSCFSCC